MTALLATLDWLDIYCLAILSLCGVVGIADVLFFRGEIGVKLSKYLGVRK
jgi:hypothetical protein